MIHRITILDRNHSLELDEFHRHWSEDHAKLIKRLQQYGLVAYTQNHGVETKCRRPSSFLIAGFAETWWPSREKSDITTLDPQLFKEVVKDEQHFLSAITAFSVAQPRIGGTEASWRVWIYDPLATPSALENLGAKISGQLALPAPELFLRDTAAVVSRRPELLSLTEDPVGVVMFPFSSEQDARSAFGQVFEATSVLECNPAVQVILTYENRVVIPASSREG